MSSTVDFNQQLKVMTRCIEFWNNAIFIPAVSL